MLLNSYCCPECGNEWNGAEAPARTSHALRSRCGACGVPNRRVRSLAAQGAGHQRWRRLARFTVYGLFLALALFGVVSAAHAEPATFSITVTQGKSVVLNRTVHIDIGQRLKIDHLAAIPMSGAACSTDPTSGVKIEQGGYVKSGFTVEVEPAGEHGGTLSTNIHLADSEYVQAIPTSAGACTGATPAMLKYDSSASFDLERTQSATLRVGIYSVTVKLIDVARPESTGIAL